MTPEQDAELSQVGPGTPMGGLMRRYWQPIAASADVSSREPTKLIRILWDASTAKRGKHHVKLGFELTDYGIIKRRLLEGEQESEDHWRMGHPILFPNILRVGMYDWHGLHYRVAMDDVTTLHIMCDLDLPKPNCLAEKQSVVPVTHWPLYDEKGHLIQVLSGPFEPYHVVVQDKVAWIAQGAISERTNEKLAATDVGIVWYRKLLKQQMDVVARGGQPMNFHRDHTDELPSGSQGRVHRPSDRARAVSRDAENETGGPFKDFVPRKPDYERVLA